ncbi:hypothetical protein K492DRAFT_134636, partial [Lichtheimia hyalospora FSU 10163]
LLMSQNLDDIWASSDEDDVTYDRDIAKREWEKLNTNHGNEGYKEGITEGKEVLMQQGFDRGYSEGIELGKAFGRLRGKLYDDLCKVDVQHVFTTDYFKDVGNHDPKEALARWEAKVQNTLKEIDVK